jgi:hypothetical protein
MDESNGKKEKRRIGFVELQESLRTGVPIEDLAARLEATREYIGGFTKQPNEDQIELLRMYELAVPSLCREIADLKEKLAVATKRRDKLE